MQRTHSRLIALTSSGLVLMALVGAAPASAAPMGAAARNQVSARVIPDPGGGGERASGSACGARMMAVGCTVTRVPTTTHTAHDARTRKVEALSVEHATPWHAPDARAAKEEAYSLR